MAKRTVKVNVPGTPSGAELEVPGIGLVVNGQEREVTDEQVIQYEDRGFTFPENGKLVIPNEAPKTTTSKEGQVEGGEDA